MKTPSHWGRGIRIVDAKGLVFNQYGVEKSEKEASVGKTQGCHSPNARRMRARVNMGEDEEAKRE